MYTSQKKEIKKYENYIVACQQDGKILPGRKGNVIAPNLPSPLFPLLQMVELCGQSKLEEIYSVRPLGNTKERLS